MFSKHVVASRENATWVKVLDGETSGPGGFKGVIGQKLDNCETRAVVKLRKIETV